jgi:formate/nitrite transporter FocA (FNT family)
MLTLEIAVMKKLMRTAMMRTAIMTVAMAAVGGFLPSEAQACPGCKNANETDSLRPRAYMYSIIFMLGMPATVFTGFGIAFYRMSRREIQEQQPQLSQLKSEAGE